VTFSWKKGATGGAPKEYFVVYKGLTKPVNLSTSFSFTATPGRYLVGVYAKNDAGKGPLATTEVTVGAGRSVYDGTFFGERHHHTHVWRRHLPVAPYLQGQARIDYGSLAEQRPGWHS
jgi:hypothetical protein